jgi:hypothetical protein
MEQKKTPFIIKSMTGDAEEQQTPGMKAEPSIFEAIASKLIDELLSSKDNLKMKSDLTTAQITHVTRAYVYASHFKSPLVKHVADTLLELLVSKGRLGRKELVGLAQSLSDYQRMDSSQSRMDLLMGKGL